MEVPQKIKNRINIQSSNSTSRYFNEENNQKDKNIYVYIHIYCYVSCNIVYNSQDMEAMCLSTGEWIKKM